MSVDALDIGILGPALLAGLLVLATHVPLGRQVLSRGIVFIDLAIAQIAGLGVIAADALGWEPQGVAVQIAAVGSALLGSMLLTFTEKRWPEVQEALIGVLFVLAACAGLLLLANNPHGGEHLKDLLVGQILWVSYAQLLPVTILTAVILALWFGARERLGRIGFYAGGHGVGAASGRVPGIRQPHRTRAWCIPTRRRPRDLGWLCHRYRWIRLRYRGLCHRGPAYRSNGRLDARRRQHDCGDSRASPQRGAPLTTRLRHHRPESSTTASLL